MSMDDFTAKQRIDLEQCRPSRQGASVSAGGVCEKCAGLGYIPCGIHGDEFTEVYVSSGQHICGKCADEGKGEASDLEICPKCCTTDRRGRDFDPEAGDPPEDPRL